MGEFHSDEREHDGCIIHHSVTSDLIIKKTGSFFRSWLKTQLRSGFGLPF